MVARFTSPPFGAGLAGFGFWLRLFALGGSKIAAAWSRAASAALLILVPATGDLSSGTAQAQSVRIVGIGAASCTRFLQEIDGKPQAEREYFAWAQGYMSGLLIRAPAGKDEDLDLMPPAFPLLKQAEFLRRFCSQNTDADFSDGVNTLYRTLRAPPG